MTAQFQQSKARRELDDKVDGELSRSPVPVFDVEVVTFIVAFMVF